MAYGHSNSGGAGAVKEPGHFEVRKSSSQVTRMHFYLQLSPSKHRPSTLFNLQNKTNKAVRYGRARQGGARA